MRLPPGFVATLRPEGQRILSRGPTFMGLVPFDASPGLSGALDVAGIDCDDGGATPASTVTTIPISGGTEPERHLHTLITSGDGNAETAGLFGIPSLSMQFSCAAGFVAMWTTAGALTSVGRGGDLFCEDFADDDSFEPDRTVGGFGWTKGSGDSAVWRWYNGTPDTTFACTGTAPTDGRRYLHVVGVAAQDVTEDVQGYALKVDLSSMTSPVVADERLFTVPSPGELKGLELNRSPGPLGSGQPTVNLRFYGIAGSYVVRSLT